MDQDWPVGCSLQTSWSKASFICDRIIPHSLLSPLLPYHSERSFKNPSQVAFLLWLELSMAPTKLGVKAKVCTWPRIPCPHLLPLPPLLFPPATGASALLLEHTRHAAQAVFCLAAVPRSLNCSFLHGLQGLPQCPLRGPFLTTLYETVPAFTCHCRPLFLWQMSSSTMCNYFIASVP